MSEGREWLMCPHFKTKIRDLWEYDGLERDGDSISTECPSCEGPIRIKVVVDYQYEIEPTAAST